MDRTHWAIHEALIDRAKAWVDYQANRKAPVRAAGGYLRVDAEGRPMAWSADVTGQGSGENTATKIAIIPIQGTMIKGGYWWGYADQQRLSELIDRINADSSYAGIVLDIDSGGGTVDGTEVLGLAVAASKKPVVAYVDGMAASAAYWVASQAKEILISSAGTTFIGSIGVLELYVGYHRALDMEGYDVEILRAGKNPDKARFNSIEPLTDEVRADEVRAMDTIKAVFDSTVKKGRGERLTPEALAQAFTGRMFPGKEAIKMGLVDRVGTIYDAIKRVAALASQSDKSGAKANMLIEEKVTVSVTADVVAEQIPAPAAAQTVAEEPAAEASTEELAEAPSVAEGDAPVAESEEESALEDAQEGAEEEQDPAPEQDAAPAAEVILQPAAADGATLRKQIATLQAEAKAKDEQIARQSAMLKNTTTPKAGEDTVGQMVTEKPLSAHDAEAIALHRLHNPKKD
jgi:protease-4